MYENLKLRNTQDFIVKESDGVSYAKHTYQGYIKDGFDITEKELAIYLDDGNLCFGGTSFISNGKFKVEVYTD